MARATRGEGALRIEVLGSLRVTVDGVEVDLRAPMHRSLLAILAIRRNRVVSTESLIDELWGVDPPAGARATLQSYVSVLRKKCRDAGLERRPIIETRQPGYVLMLSDTESDAAEFDTLIGRARQLAAAGVLEDDLDPLRAATALSEGPILADLDHLPTVRSFAADVSERRAWAVEQLVLLDLAHGRASQVVPELQRMADANPIEERTAILLMRALYLSNRQADALRAYQRLRDALIDQLGVEPSADAQRLEADILQGELDCPQTSPPVSEVRAPVGPPHSATSLIGRDDEIAGLEELIRDRRLVTVSGPGGCGKTRLVAEVAHRIGSHFDEVAWVSLETLGAGAAVEDAVAAGLGVRRRPTEGLVDLLITELSSSRSLVVLDNCEHVIDNVAVTIEKLLAACPDLHVAVTSREHLLMPGETTMALDPLASASPLALARARFDRPSDAALLFADRAGLDGMRPDQLAIVEAICAQLDGIPLAIELAAPLTSTMSLDDMADGLLDRFRLLAAGARGAAPHHRTLRAVVEWSHDLLEDEERDAFMATAVFRGSFTSDAASAVLQPLGIDPVLVLPSLVRKSMLLAHTDRPGGTRYQLLETLRAFGEERLAADPRADEVRRGFLRFYVDVALRWQDRKQTVAVRAWMDELGDDIPNLRAAVALARELDVDAALLLVDSFQWYFDYLGSLETTRRWLQDLIETQELSLQQRAMVRVGQAALANFSGDYGSTGALAEEALEAARELGDPRRLNAALIMRGTTATFEGKAQRAAECFIESAALSEELGDQGGMAASMVFWGIAHRRRGDFDEAQRCLDAAFDGFSRLGDDRGLALTVGNMGRLAHQRGDHERADELTHRAVVIAAQSLDPMVGAQCGLFRGHYLWDRGDMEGAFAQFEATLHYTLGLENRTMSSAALEWMVMVGGGRPERVAVIDAFTTVRRNSPDTADARVEWDAAVAEARDALAADAHAAFTAQGAAMTLDEAIAYARDAARPA